MKNESLALAGGVPAVRPDAGLLPWPATLPADERAVLAALRAGDLTSLSAGGAVEQLEAAWAAWLKTDHCIAVSNGTAALKLALAALDVGPGDEVLVPSLSFIASALAPLHVNARPVFVDIDPVTFNIDPKHALEKITGRTRAIIVVHLHGLAADMDPLLEIAQRFDLRIIEDAAQAHGARYQGRDVGTIGDIGVFSLNASKNLPTCGEGGLLTTNSTLIADKLRMLRQFGERLVRGERRLYQHDDFGWNNKMNAVQAAYTHSQLQRFSDDIVRRAANVKAFLSRLKGLPGLVVPEEPENGRHAWHILRFRIDARGVGRGEVASAALLSAVQRALRSEGVPVGPYQRLPLPAQPVFASTARQSMSRQGKEIAPVGFDAADFPACCAVIQETFTLQKAHLHPEAGPVLELYAGAFEKVLTRNIDLVLRIAQTHKPTPPWGEMKNDRH